MRLLTIGLNIYDPDQNKLSAALKDACANLSYSGYELTVESEIKGFYQLVSCHINEGELSFYHYEQVKQLVKQAAAKIVTEYIVDTSERLYLRRLVERNGTYFSNGERAEVLAEVLARYELEFVGANHELLQERRRQVEAKLLDYLATSHDLITDGFVWFRLKTERNTLARIVDRTIDDFMMKLEYEEFIRVLRYFVDLEQPKREEIHVAVLEGSRFQLFDENGDVILQPYTDALYEHEKLGDQDMLISSLITLAPYTIMLHFADPSLRQASTVADTVRSVFQERVIVCDGCNLCGSLAAAARKTSSQKKLEES